MFKQIATLLFDLSMCKRVLCLGSKFEVCVPGSRVRLGDRGQQRKEKEEQGGTRHLKSPGQGWRMPEEMVAGSGQSWVHPKAGQRRGVTLSISLSRKKRTEVGETPKSSPKLQPQWKTHLARAPAELVLQEQLCYSQQDGPQCSSFNFPPLIPSFCSPLSSPSPGCSSWGGEEKNV